MTSELNKQVKSRADYRKSRNEERNSDKRPRRKEKIRIRVIPIWFRLILVAILLTVSVLVGVVVGYGVIGDGEPSDALKKNTWQHIYDLINTDNEK